MASARPLRRTRPAAARPRPESQRFPEAASFYGIPSWGKGFFHVSEEGDLVVRLADAVWAFAPHDVDNRSGAWQDATRPAAARRTGELVHG